MPVLVSNINIYRDGGSIEFRIERDNSIKSIYLDTPFNGEPRALKIDSVVVRTGEPTIVSLQADLDAWWTSLSPEIQEGIRTVQERDGPFFNPSTETSRAIDLSYVCQVRDYLLKNYIG